MKLVVVCVCVFLVCVLGMVSCNKPENTPDPSGAKGSSGGTTPPAAPGGDAAAAKAAEAAKAAAGAHATDSEWAASALGDPSKGNLTAPDVFKAKFETSKGDFVIEVHRDWSPNGADRFYNLVKMGFYDDVRFFRVVKGFMAQLGMNGDPSIHSKWSNANIPDDPVKKSNQVGYVTFAKTRLPNSRSTQIFISYRDNSFLDRQGFAPFGVVLDDGMNVVSSLYSDYGDGPPSGRGPRQDLIQGQGNAYLKQNFPNLDYVKRATIVP